MAKHLKSTASKRKPEPTETDGAYFLKLVLYLILGSLWVKVTTADGVQIPVPAGFILGIIFAAHDHFQIDRKIEYALLLAAVLIGFWLPIGVFVSL